MDVKTLSVQMPQAPSVDAQSVETAKRIGEAATAKVAGGLERAADSFERAPPADVFGSRGGGDVMALVQHVLRESYQDSVADLRSYAEKVKYFNQAKNEVREALGGLRAGAADGSVRTSAEGTVRTPGGYELAIARDDLKVTTPGGDTLRIWGDPHVDDTDGEKWDLKQDGPPPDLRLVLGDGTRIEARAETRDPRPQGLEITSGGGQVAAAGDPALAAGVGRLAEGFAGEAARLSEKADLESARETVKTKLDSLSELGETESLRLQMAMDRMSKLMSALSNLLKKASDTASGVTQNIK
jgi:hypothetical protein